MRGQISTFSIISELLFTPTFNMFMCYPLVIPTWYPLRRFTWNFSPGEARCELFVVLVTGYDFSSFWHSRAEDLEYFEIIFRHYGM